VQYCLYFGRRWIGSVKLKKLCRSAVAVVLSCVTAVGGGILPVFAADDSNDEYIASAETLAAMEEDYYTIEPVDSEMLSFSDYYDIYSAEKRPDKVIEVKGADYASLFGDMYVGSYSADGIEKDDALIWQENGGEVLYNINVEESGIYCLNIDYCPLISNSPSIEVSVKIDGKLPYETASRITLNRVWVNEHDIYKDSKGNQVRPAQVQTEMWQNCWVGDVDGLFSQPLFFFLEEGMHEVSFSSERAQFALESFRFANPEEIPSYDDYASSVKASVTREATPSRIFRIEGENAVYKSDSTLYPAYDNTNYLVSPSDPRKIVYNTLGGGNWKKALQSVTWDIPKEDIGNDGWYKIGIKSRQDQMRGFYSNRRIYVDGKVICKEMEQVGFYYDKDWNVVSPRAGEDYIYVYLDASVDHTITLEAVPGETGEYLRRLEDVVSDLNTYYRKALMITGPSPDKYTDYYVHEKIPELIGEFSRISEELKEIQSGIESLSGSSGSEAAALETMAVILDKCVDKPLKIPSYLSQIKDSITSVSAWMRDYRDQPLEVDYIEFASPDRDFTSCKRKLLKSAEFSLKAFIGSFFEDYATLSDVTGEEAIEVWVSLGRDQAQVIKEMTESQFMQEYNIPVSVNLVTGGVVEATLAGKGPDVALFLGGEFPVNLAARDLLTDMTQFGDFAETAERFQENAMTHYTYNGGVYGLPVSQSFPMMFYRTDILSELDYSEPPETWNDLMDMLPAIQRNYMSVGLILPQTDISPATESGHTFAMLLLQKGKNYYNDELTATSFDSIEAVQAFEQWTDFYTEYSFKQSYDAFSRFRTGEYPIVIADYTFYNQLAAASPEIKGLWDFCQVPGTVREDGTVSHAANSKGSGAVIFSKTKNKENAWKFVKWFTETETQVQYGRQIEGLLGTMGRFDTANLEALGQLSWSEDELARLRDQQEELVEIPITPASYAVTRNIMNAFRETVNEKQNPRDTLIWYNRDINEEIERKHENM
jgi:extracellular solute-binding protein